MKKISLFPLLAATTVSQMMFSSCSSEQEKEQPNFVLIFCDDMGYGDLGCYGNPTIHTPNIDRMASEGMKFTQFYVGASVSTPSRSALMTGRLPVRNGLYGDKRDVLFPDSKAGLGQDEVTVAKLLQQNGYATACVGKWHLGHFSPYLPTDHGFDDFFGIPYSNDMRPASLMRGDSVLEIKPEQGELTRRYTEYAVDYIKKNKNRPFFLYLAHTFPHTPLHTNERFEGRSNRGLYGDVVEELDFESILAERKATLISLYPEDQQEAVARTLTMESEPLVKLLEENAYRELIWRQRVNEAARAVMLACAAANDLDNIGANYNVERLVITPADETTLPPTPAVMESDTDYRLRIQQAFEGMSVAGSTGAYQFHGRSADGRVADISVISPEPACVTVSVLSRENNGAASGELLAVVRNALNDEDVRPVADRVTVQSAVIVDYTIDAALYLYPGPESEPVLSAAKAKLQTYISAQHRLGRDIRKSAIYAALHVEGVQRVELVAPVADIVLNETQASYCTAYSVNIGGNDE